MEKPRTQEEIIEVMRDVIHRLAEYTDGAIFNQKTKMIYDYRFKKLINGLDLLEQI